MKNRILTFLAAAALLIFARANASALGVGDPAPKLQVARWAQGEPVKEFESSKIYIVEFWATWCGPCVRTIPHLNELHEKFKDKGVVVIGQNLGENEDKVNPFIEKMADKMTYRVAIEDNGAMGKNWMSAAGQSGIPCAFVVDKKGKIVWIGHPGIGLTEKLLEDILADRYDPKKGGGGGSGGGGSDAEVKIPEKKKAPAQRPAPYTKNFQTMTLIQRLGASLREQDWEDAETTITALEKLLPENQRAQYTIERFRIFIGRKDFDGAYKFLSQTSDAHLQDAALQNRIAWAIASREGMAQRDLILAEKIADRAVIASNGKDANVLDTLARVQFLNGKQSEAIATQQKAVEIAASDVKAGLRTSLASYQAGKLPEAGN